MNEELKLKIDMIDNLEKLIYNITRIASAKALREADFKDAYRLLDALRNLNKILKNHYLQLKSVLNKEDKFINSIERDFINLRSMWRNNTIIEMEFFTLLRTKFNGLKNKFESSINYYK